MRLHLFSIHSKRYTTTLRSFHGVLMKPVYFSSVFLSWDWSSEETRLLARSAPGELHHQEAVPQIVAEDSPHENHTLCEWGDSGVLRLAHLTLLDIEMIPSS